jgi:hypothetical protein
MAAQVALRGIVVGIASLAVLLVLPGTASAGAEVVYPDGCGWGPDETDPESIPGTGITEFIPATYCKIVFTPSGRANFVIKGRLPEGTAVHPALRAPGVGVVTPSGRINAAGSF